MLIMQQNLYSNKSFNHQLLLWFLLQVTALSITPTWIWHGITNILLRKLILREWRSVKVPAHRQIDVNLLALFTGTVILSKMSKFIPNLFLHCTSSSALYSSYSIHFKSLAQNSFLHYQISLSLSYSIPNVIGTSASSYRHLVTLSGTQVTDVPVRWRTQGMGVRQFIPNSHSKKLSQNQFPQK